MRKISIIVILIISYLTEAQSINDLKNAFTNNIKSPQLTDFIRYGNIPIKKNIGELDLNIPLLTLPIQNGNNIDISLAYNASGFIPNKKSGIVGFNWSLMAGGVITREVKGEMDEQLGSPESLGGWGGHNEHGYLAGIRQFAGNTTLLPSDNDLLNYSPSKLILDIDSQTSRFYEIRIKGYPNNPTTPYETTPDIFSFSFNGISGKFFIAPNGTIEVTTTEPHKLSVDLSNFNLQPLTAVCTPLNTSEIKIIDEKGNKYFFGGESKNLEYVNNSSNRKEYTSSPVITSWYLTRVELVNSDVIYYDYLNDQINIPDALSFCSQSSLFWHQGSLHDEMKTFIDFSMNNSVFDQCNTMVNDKCGIQSKTNNTLHFSGEVTGYTSSYNLTKKAYLGSIRYKDYRINFVYSDQDNLYKNIQDTSITVGYMNFKQKKLDAVELFSNSNLVSRYDLSYEVYGAPYPRAFLKSVQENNKNPYILNYDLTNANSIPKPYTAAVDYWGYYNGKLTNDPNSSTPKLVPEMDYDTSNGNFQYTTDNREPNFNFSKTFALTSIIYPTKGMSSFVYEPHQYSMRLERNSTNDFIPSLFNVNGIAGGTRIKKITDNDGSADMVSREFHYGDGLPTGGILSDWPRFRFYVKSLTNYSLGQIHITANEQLIYTSASSISKNLSENSIISYPEVSETQSNKGTAIEYYTSYLDKPDIFNNNISNLTAGSFTPMPSTQNIFLMPNDISIERGKIKKRIVKDDSGNVLEETNVLYNEDPNRYNKFHISMNLSNAWVNTLKTYYYNDFTSSSVTKKYFNNNLVKTTTNYFYENPNHNMLTKTSVLLPDNSVNETIINYADEEGNSYLTGKNIIGVPLVTEIKKNSKSLSKTKLNYPIDQTDANKYTSGLPLPKSALSYDLQNIGTSQTELTYDRYDNKGNVLQYTLKDGITTTLIWGYNQTNLIAKIEGATYPDPQNPKPTDISQSLITTLTTASNADAALAPRSDESTFLTALNTFRTDSTLKDYQITTYTYDPLIGVRSITPPNGITEFYKYDTANRLEKILDKDNNILKEYKYSLLTYYNDEQNRPFVRNNCGADYFGESYTYTVSAGTYSSTISKEDANQKAINDINANGQNAANIYGVCNHTCIATPEDQNSLQSYTSFHEISPNHYLGVVNVTFLEETRFQVSLGLIGSCAPNTIKTYTHNDGTRTWTITLNPNGSVILKGPSSYVIPVGQNVSFSFEYDK